MVGIVGAGGIGGTLFSAFQRFDYDFVAAILLSIIAMIMAGRGARDLGARRVPRARQGGRRVNAALAQRVEARTWRRFTHASGSRASRSTSRSRWRS
jgi:hypothetical protein